MSLDKIRKNSHTLFLKVRNCNYLIQSDNFEIAYKKSNVKEQKEIEKYIQSQNKEKIKEFIVNRIEGDFEEMGIRKLRSIAKFLRMKNFQILNKASLIEDIRSEIYAIKTNCKPVPYKSEQVNC
jgi:NADH pyrophosphatase NudC (nudix superfamily)